MTGCHRCRWLETCICGGLLELLDAPAPDGDQQDDTELYIPAPRAGA